MRKKIDSIHVRSFKAEVTKLVKKHEKVLIIFAGDGDLRRRMIKEDGTCDVSYRQYGKHRWSRYDDSCFMSYTEDQKTGGFRTWDTNRWIPERIIKKGKKKNLKNTLDALVKHDKNNEIVPLEIKYGKGLKKTLFVRGNY